MASKASVLKAGWFPGEKRQRCVPGWGCLPADDPEKHHWGVPDCPDEFESVDDGCYRLLNETVDFEKAFELCEKEEAELAKLDALDGALRKAFGGEASFWVQSRNSRYGWT